MSDLIWSEVPERHRLRIERLFRENVKVDSPSGCHIWAGTRDKNGYGSVYNGVKTRSWRCHRVAYAMAFGTTPAGSEVMHRCDTPACVNPEHLSIGDRVSNALDAVAKGRNPFGSRHGMAKLTETDIPAIRRDPRPLKIIAQDYGVAPETIYDVRRGATWRHC